MQERVTADRPDLASGEEPRGGRAGEHLVERQGIVVGHAEHRPAGALVFTCNGRGRGMFGEPDHDALALDEELAGAPAAGFFAAGEIGPVGGDPFLHGFTATVAVFPE